MRRYLIYCAGRTQYDRVRAKCFTDDVDFISRKDVKIGDSAASYYILSDFVPKDMKTSDLVIIDILEKVVDDANNYN